MQTPGHNDGVLGFTRRVLDPSLDGAYPASVADLDLDGDIDILAAGYDADTFVWYENDGEAEFTRRVIDDTADGAHSIVASDLDADGDVDLVTTNQDADTVTWYENDGSQVFAVRDIDVSASGAKRAEVADVDGDGDLDVLAASFFDDRVVWHENDGDTSFTERLIDDTADGAYFVTPADIDGDGDVDALAASQLDGVVAWHENDGSGSFVKHVIDAEVGGARTVETADFDGDGDRDAVATSVDDGAIIWYENDGAGNFRSRPVDLGASGAYGVFPIDFDRDGDDDIVSASRDDNALAIHLQSQIQQVVIDETGYATIDGLVLTTADNNTPPEDLTYTVELGPQVGALLLDGAVISPGGMFTQADIDAGRVTYEGSPNGIDRIDYSVSDGESPAAAGSLLIAPPQSGALTAELLFDEGSGTVANDTSGNGNDGRLSGGASYVSASPDASPSAVQLDGSDGRIDLPALDLQGSGLTLAVWFRPVSFAVPDARLISKASSTAEDDHIFMLSMVRQGVPRLRARVRVAGVTTTLVASDGEVPRGPMAARSAHTRRAGSEALSQRSRGGKHHVGRDGRPRPDGSGGCRRSTGRCRWPPFRRCGRRRSHPRPSTDGV